MSPVLSQWAPVVYGEFSGCWCWVELDSESQGICLLLRTAPCETAELRFTDWFPSFEALHTALRDYPWRVDWSHRQRLQGRRSWRG